MKMLKSLSFLLIPVFLAFALVACNNESNATQTDQSKESTDREGDAKQGKEYTAAYVCPMHCEGSGSDSPGTCPVCGMDYVKNEKHADHQHDGHDHGDHEGHDH